MALSYLKVQHIINSHILEIFYRKVEWSSHFVVHPNYSQKHQAA